MKHGPAAAPALVADFDPQRLAAFLRRYGLRMNLVPCADRIPGSYWGDREAGLIGDDIFVRLDTPAHSLLHESAHFVCMTAQRRARLDTDAGGDEAEENAVCYLQILCAGEWADFGRDRMCRDMDEWGYTFRLGSAAEWFARDAADAQQWLLRRAIIDMHDRLTYRRVEHAA